MAAPRSSSLHRPGPGEVARFRARLERTLRNYFAECGFVEVSTPSLVPNPGMEPHLDAVAARVRHASPLAGRWLHTSPELAIKSVFAELQCDVVCFARCYRDEPLTRWHHPEFTMIEWYRANADYTALMRDCEGLLRAAVSAFSDRSPFAPGFDAPLDLDAPFERITCRDAFARWAGVDIVEADLVELRAAARRTGVDIGDDWDRDSVFTVLYSERIEPNLGFPRPTFITEFPSDQAALSRRKPGDPAVAERFELYVGGRWERAPGRGGIELANAFSELIDPDEQRARFDADLRKRIELGRDVYPMPEDMLAGLGSMPPTAGIALGFERLAVWVAEAVLDWEIGVADLLLGEPRADRWRQERGH